MSEQDNTQQPEDGKAAEEQQEQPTGEQSSEEQDSDDDRDAPWDPERAKRTIAKIASEKKALRERVTAAEQKAAGVDDLTQENGGLKATVLQLEVGYELGLPLAIAKRLQGSTREEMLADAETLVELVAPSKKAAPSRRPQENLRGGGAPAEESEETDVSKLGNRMFRR